MNKYSVDGMAACKLLDESDCGGCAKIMHAEGECDQSKSYSRSCTIPSDCVVHFAHVRRSLPQATTWNLVHGACPQSPQSDPPTSKLDSVTAIESADPHLEKIYIKKNVLISWRLCVQFLWQRRGWNEW